MSSTHRPGRRAKPARRARSASDARTRGDAGPRPDPRLRRSPEHDRFEQVRAWLPYLAWLLALVATLGSLFFSEVMGYPPCTLCWYQRIAMYPLVIVLAVGILRRDGRVYLSVLPLSIVGLAIATYHNLLYVGIIPEAAAACRAGISCTTRFFEWFGFVTIPFLSLTAFALITTVMIMYWRTRPR